MSENNSSFKMPKWALTLITVVIMLFSPIVFFGIIRFAHYRYSSIPSDYQFLISVFLGSFLGMLAHITLALVGLFDDAWNGFISRTKDFFYNIKVSFKSALKWGFKDFIGAGIPGLIYLLVFIANIVICILTFIPVFDIYVNGML